MEVAKAEEAKVAEQKTKERAEAQAIQAATKHAQDTLKGMFPNMSDEYGDTEKMRYIADRIVHALNIRSDDEIDFLIQKIIKKSSSRYHGIDRVYSVLGGHNVS